VRLVIAIARDLSPKVPLERQFPLSELGHSDILTARTRQNRANITEQSADANETGCDAIGKKAMPLPFLFRYRTLTQSINPKFNSANISTTAAQIMAVEKKTGQQYVFGSWAPTQQLSAAQWGGADAENGWVEAVNDVPSAIRKAMTELVRGNLLSAQPMPMAFDVALGADHGLSVGYGKDSIDPTIPCILVTMICKQ
jgi:hypothetical protein